MEIKDYINGTVTYDKEGQCFWINTPNGGLQMLAELRGWGVIQNRFNKIGGGGIDEKAAAAFQDQVGQFIADAINDKINK